MSATASSPDAEGNQTAVSSQLGRQLTGRNTSQLQTKHTLFKGQEGGRPNAAHACLLEGGLAVVGVLARRERRQREGGTT